MYIKDIIADTILPLISLLILGSSYKKLTAAFRIIFYYLIIVVAVFLYSNILADRQINNLFLYHLFTPIEVAFVAWFISKSFVPYVPARLVALIFGSIVLTSIFNVFAYESISTMDLNMKILSNFIILAMCLFSFVDVVKAKERVMQIQLSHFLFLFGFFIYAASSIIIYSYFNYKNYHGKELSNMLWSFHDNILIVKYLLFITASILCIRTKPLK
ncbi:MAG TPA: hypothetical protein PK504_04500 [Ferruginibacter sp.]|nr:hypothetical protein [Ferruginibacter sp.]HRE62864.1 hypothetical protein [Ferruginibacter sp.]